MHVLYVTKLMFLKFLSYLLPSVHQPLSLVLQKKLNESASTAKKEGSALSQSTSAEVRKKKNEGGRCSIERVRENCVALRFALVFTTIPQLSLLLIFTNVIFIKI